MYRFNIITIKTPAVSLHGNWQADSKTYMEIQGYPRNSWRTGWEELLYQISRLIVKLYWLIKCDINARKINKPVEENRNKLLYICTLQNKDDIHSGEEKIVFSANHAGTIVYLYWKIWNWTPYLIPYTKSVAGGLKDLNVKIL